MMTAPIPSAMNSANLPGDRRLVRPVVLRTLPAAAVGAGRDRLSVLIVRLDQLELDEADDEDEGCERPGYGAGIPEVEEVEGLVVHVAEEHLGLAQGPTAGHDVELDEALEGADGEQDGDEQGGGLQQRHGDEARHL